MAKGLFKSGMIVSAMTMLSRILGLVRDAVVANLLGAGLAADVFLFANRIPNFFRRLFAEGAFAQAFVPVLSEIKEKHGDDEVRVFVAQAAGTLGTILLCVTLFGVVGSPIIAALFGTTWFIDWWQGGENADKFLLASALLKFTIPYLFFISLVALCGAVMNVYNRFSVAAFTPVLLNVCLISCALLLHDHFEQGAYALAIGVFIGGAAQLAFQIPFLGKLGMLSRPKFAWHAPHVTKVRKLMLPAIFGVSVSQINLLLDTIIAAALMTGSIAWLYYSDRLIEFPLGLFGIAIATVILPTLSKLHANDKGENFQQTMDWGVRFVLLLGFPAMGGLIVISPLIISVLFGHGEFKNGDVDNIAAVSAGVTAYSVGLVSFMLIKVLAPGFYARQDTKTPVKIGIKALTLNMIFNLALAPFFGYLGLALATSLSATCNAFLLYRGLKREQVYTVSTFTLWFAAKAIFATLVMASSVYWLSHQLTWRGEGIATQLWVLGSLLASAIFLYFCILYVCGVRVSTIKEIRQIEE
ncbi:murein biosynthesis integral membrane protein MurJ [Pseudoalteromonas luteoviolacea]|uniref:murein biosynthesis integral membrane protein MurJ n=1 Tax=Pseudoalteromonas luteoviolacea TaxID=43657 RepID=UPI0031BB32AA